MSEPSPLRRPTDREVRDELERLVLGDLLGPKGSVQDEELTESPRDWYLLGMLAPRRTGVPAEELDPLAHAGDLPGDDAQPEPAAPPVRTLFPSSIGLTCSIDGAASEVRLTGRWGRYRRERGSAEDKEGSPGLVWRRYPAGGSALLRLGEGEFGPIPLDPEQPQVIARGRVRRFDGEWILTAFLINEQPEPSQYKDANWLFQVELELDEPDGSPVFLRRPSLGGEAATADPEAAALAMAYRHQVEFAVGHGVGVHAEPDGNDPDRARLVRTVAAPAYEVPATEAPTAGDFPLLADATLDMAALADTPDAELPARLGPLVGAYEDWIQRQGTRVGDPATRLAGHEDAASLALAACSEAADRIRAGIDLLGHDEDAARAFRFANRAMWQQRIHTLAAERRRRDPNLAMPEALTAVDVPGERSWRPFQLAFILLNLPALTDPTHPDRGEEQGLVDLLWFPTGGGKTEAYLGLTAYTLALRRLQGTVAGHDGHDGVAVLMRYTLRLLTLQQFQRAAALVCACELLRREALEAGDERLGHTPFRVGLWVGRAATPNKTADADAWVRQRRGAATWWAGQGSSPAQLTSCPWCGSPIKPEQHITVDTDRGRTVLSCGDPLGTCPFTARRSPGEGLPVVVVDEEVYRLLPALLIGTVDKFAQMPWQGPVQALFGRISGRCERHGFRTPDLEDSDTHPRRGTLPAARTLPAGPLRPPDLIIQDELHLIAGPLGSLVGLYETAVDHLCSWQVDGRTVRPKVIASTATVRRAGAQVHRLFLRGVKVFPPAGLDAGDSFFALQRPVSDEHPGRRYVGICAHGSRFKAVLIRVFVAELAAAQRLAELYGPEAADPYMTLVGYFNSLRELGGMRRLVDDDVATRLKHTQARGLARRQRPEVQELTSRLGSAGIPEVLDRLHVPFQADRPKGSPIPIDVLLATNMIAVGVDVPRLGAMVVGGQPKATAEYIQATSRIGRSRPGLVLTVLNWARPRDLSHYETFEHYHATFYRQVEALSITPFAARALDRGLTAVLVSLLRLGGSDWNANLTAGRVDPGAPLAKQAVAVIADRAAEAMSEVSGGDEARNRLHSLLDRWAALAAVPNRRLGYRPLGGRGEAFPLLQEPGVGPWNEWTCLTSLRDVEPEIGLLLTQSDLGETGAPPYELAPAPDEEHSEEGGAP
jgi:Helicase conserved C-terminal domain